MNAKIKSLELRVPITAADRADIVNPDAAMGSAVEGWPAEALAITGVWPASLNRALTVRPIFPGVMRFIADKPSSTPSLEEVRTHVQNGRINDAYLDTLTPQGTLLVRLQHSEALNTMREIGTIEPIGEAPTFALYGPIRLGRKFLRDALLDFNLGLLAGMFVDGGRVITPGDLDWEAQALAGFLAGRYEPVIRPRKELGADDVEEAPMPEIVINADRRFALGVAIGWMRDSRKASVSVGDVNLEIIPTTAFLRHVASRVRENVLDAGGVDPLMSKIFANENSSEPWVARLTNDLKSMGFGALDDSLPLEQVIREFQISATRPIAATARTLLISQQQLALRHFGDLQATDNLAVYSGAISGRANQDTRRLIRAWAANAQRCPLLITAYRDTDLDANKRPKTGAVPAHADLWSRKETTSPALCMFAADFSRLAPGLALTVAELELIGYYAPHQKTTGGPGTLMPNLRWRVAYAEVTPRRLLEVDEGELLAALSPAAAVDARALASTFKVIRAVAECECFGYLDQITAYDDAGISYGPCHWSMAMAIANPTGRTELGGLAAYLRYLSKGNLVPEVDVFPPQGLAAAQPPGLDARAVARMTNGASYSSQLCFVDDRGRPRPMGAKGPEVMIPSWRSFYRWVEIGRRHQHIGLATWRMAVRRLHRLSATPIILVPASGGQPAVSVTIGAAFTSEIVVAQLLRWHVKIPGAVVTGSGSEEKASSNIVKAYKEAAALASPSSGAAWSTALIQQLRVSLDAFIKETGKRHDELDNHFDNIANAPWINESTNPPSISNPKLGYTLNPLLRILSGDDDSFRLAALSNEP